MSKSRSRQSFLASARGALMLALGAAALFVGGELLLLGRTDAGLISLAKHLNLVGRARVTQILSSAMKRALRAQGVGEERIAESFPERARAPLRWEVELPAGASLVLANFALTQAVQTRSARVISGREERLPDGGARLTLLVGLARYATHEVVLRRPPPPPVEERQTLLALVLFGFAPDDPGALSVLEAPVPFAVAALPGSPHFPALLERARRGGREVLLSLPLEPLDYPRVDPGPGTVRVTMKPLEVRRQVRRHLDAAGRVVAVSNHHGSLATQDVRVMRYVYQELRDERLPFVHVDPVPGEVCKQLSSEMGVLYQPAFAALEGEARSGDLRKLDRGWKRLLPRLQDRRRAVMFLRATPAVRAWLPRLADPRRRPGVDLVPLSSLAPKPLAL